MIGNDIVDLKFAEAESNWHRKGYLQKIFTEREIEIIGESTNPGLTVWLLWSMKESAYKIENRRTGIRKFNPTAFKTSVIETKSATANGTMVCNGISYFTRSRISKKCVDTVAVTDPNFFTLVRDVPKDLPIYKHRNLPFLDPRLQIPVSISHHGSFNRAIYLMNPQFSL